MDRPRVIIHNLVSLDAHLGGFPADIGLYYELASRLPHQAVLTGSGTMLAAAASQGIDMAGEDPASPAVPAAGSSAGRDERPILVIVDSRGRLTRYAWLRQQPFWRGLLVLCSSATPASHLGRLRQHHVEHCVLGDGHVDLSAALHVLADKYQVTTIRVDAGGRLNEALLRAGLADEVSVIIAPWLAASAADPARLVAGTGHAPALALDLTAVERLRQGHIWLRYTVPAAASHNNRSQDPNGP